MQALIIPAHVQAQLAGRDVAWVISDIDKSSFTHRVKWGGYLYHNYVRAWYARSPEISRLEEEDVVSKLEGYG